jgi:hypothetical protein
MSVALLLPTVLQRAAAVASPLVKPIDAPLNLFETLKKSGSFIGQDGEPVDIDALKKQLEGQLTTLTFGFAHCTEYCPYINGSLGALHRHNKTGITSIIIAANPAGDGNEDKGDGATRASRDAFMKDVQLMMKPLDQENAPDCKVVILYPTDASGKLSNEAVLTVTNAFNSMANATNSKKHTADIALFNRNGILFAQETAVPSNDPGSINNFRNKMLAILDANMNTPPKPVITR